MLDDRIEAKLAAYIDGQLPPEELAEVERHLANDPRQRQVVEQMLQARRWVATLPRVRAPAEILESIDPSLERSALFAAAPEPRSRWSVLASPQALALAATFALVVTLAAAMIWLVPDRGGGDPIADVPRVPDVGPGETESDPEGPEESAREGMNGALVDGETRPPVPEEAVTPVDGANEGANTPEEALPPRLRLPRNASDAVLVSANVGSIPQASGAVSQFLTGQDLPFDAQRTAVSDLPEDLRSRLGVADDQAVYVYVIESISLQQVGALTSELTGEGDAVAHTPAGFAARREPLEEPTTSQAPREGEQAQRIISDDSLSLRIQRIGEPPETTPAGMPQIGADKTIQVSVTADGYADFGEIGLGRIDVLGKLPAELAEEIRSTLSRNFQIESKVQVSHATQAEPQGGRTREAVQLIYLDREPLVAGDIVQIELPDGSWLHTAVDEHGMIDAGAWGRIEAAGTSAVDVQAKLRELAAARSPVEEPATQEAAVAPPIRVLNLSARRAEGVDGWAQEVVTCLVILHDPSSAADEWAPLLSPTTQPTTRPATQPATQPATP